MNDNNNHDSLQRSINYQRRSVSVGDTPLRMIEDNQSEPCDDEETIVYNQYITKSDDNGYICTPLPRANGRSTAQTCWLVVMFSPLYITFPIIRLIFTIYEKYTSSYVEKHIALNYAFCYRFKKKTIWLLYITNCCFLFLYLTFFSLSLCLYVRENMSFYRRSFIYLNTVICLRREITLTKLMTSSFSIPLSRRSISMSADSSQMR
jgi:hypothetical protein